jgi:hypothetical protein
METLTFLPRRHNCLLFIPVVPLPWPALPPLCSRFTAAAVYLYQLILSFGPEIWTRALSASHVTPL